MTEFQIEARATWTGAEFAITVDVVADAETGNYFIEPNDPGAKVIESLRARGYHVVDNRIAYYEALTTDEADAEASGETPTPTPLPPVDSPPTIPFADPTNPGSFKL